MKKLLLLLLLLPRLVFGAVGYDVSSTATGNGVSSATWTHTVGSISNTLIICSYHGQSAAVEVSAFTYNSANLTAKGQSISGSDPGIDMRFLAGVATGAHSASLTTFDAVSFATSCSSFSGVDPGTPLGTATAVNNDPLDSGSLTVPSSGMLYEDSVWGRGSNDCLFGVAQASGQTREYTACGGPLGVGGTYSAFGSIRSTTGNFTYNSGVDAWTAMLAVPINAFVSTATAVRRFPVWQ